MSNSRVTIMLLTYNRMEYARKTLTSALKHIKYDGPLDVHIADDGSPDGYIDELVAIATECGVDLITHTNSERHGYGANYNLATQVVHQRADIILPLEDDWELLRELDLNLYVPVLEDHILGCIRLGYLGFTQELRSNFVSAHGAIWIKFYDKSREPHIWAGHPRLESVEWQRMAGEWPEKLEPGYTEFVVAQRESNRRGVGWPMEYVRPSGNLFAHIGTERSY